MNLNKNNNPLAKQEVIDSTANTTIEVEPNVNNFNEDITSIKNTLIQFSSSMRSIESKLDNLLVADEERIDNVIAEILPDEQIKILNNNFELENDS